MKKDGNPQYCEVHSNGFILDRLFPSSTSGNSHYDLLGSTIQLGKPSALKIVKDLEYGDDPRNKEPYKQVIVGVTDKEYESTRLTFSRHGHKYKIMDIEQTILLGYIHENTFEAFAGS